MPAVPAIQSMLRVMALLAATTSASAATSAPEVPDDLAQAVAQLEQRMRRDPRRVDAADLESYLHEVLCRLDAGRCAGLRPLILLEPGFNASIAPGGLIVLRSGALLRCRDEAELALVLAHELAHERRGDGRERWRRAGAGRDDDRGGLRSRDSEAAADAIAIAMLAAAGYDVAAGERLWTRLQAEDASAAPGRRKPGASHPSAAERLAAFRTATTRLRGQEGHVPAGDTGRERWRQRTAPHRQAWLDEEVARGRPAATVAMLGNAIASERVASALDRFALGQALRRRDSPGDRARAAELYAQAVGHPDAPATAWREHGLARLAEGDEVQGKAALRHYLEREPQAADAEFVAAMLAPGPDPAPAHVGTAATGRVRSGPGVVRVFDLRLRTALPWARRRGIGLEHWTLDGTDQNRLLLVPGLRPGEPLFRDAGKPNPRHRPGLRPDEQRDLVVAALDAAGWRVVRADGPRRHDFGGVPGWQSNLALADAEGVRYRGSATFVERDGRLTLLLWLAEAAQQYPRDVASVEAMLESARFAD